MECGKVECGAHLLFGNAKSDIGDRRHPILGMVNGQIGDTNQIGDKVVCCSQYFILMGTAISLRAPWMLNEFLFLCSARGRTASAHPQETPILYVDEWIDITPHSPILYNLPRFAARIRLLEPTT